jgi:formamidopyrimidine-DNA glycosylase
MPELPEVETTRRGLEPVMLGRRIVNVTARRKDLRVALPPRFVEQLEGKAIRALRRRAKYLLIDLDSDEVLLIHLGMSGSLRTVDPKHYGPKTHDHVIFHLDDGRCVVFHDPRRFGLMDIYSKEAEAANRWLAHLGPEPLEKAFNARYLAAALAKRKTPIKPTLMDQQLVVGVGNIYASESLYLAGIDPRAPSYAVSDHAPALVRAIKKTLNAAIKSGGSTLRDYVGAEGDGGYFQHHFNVYDREAEKCFACKKLIQHLVQSARATYYCAQCQRIGANPQKP